MRTYTREFINFEDFITDVGLSDVCSSILNSFAKRYKKEELKLVDLILILEDGVKAENTFSCIKREVSGDIAKIKALKNSLALTIMTNYKG